MTDDRSRRLSRAIRRNRGRALLADWLRRFNSLTGAGATSEALLTLEGTEALKRAFVDRMQAGDICYREWPAAQRDDVVGFLRGLLRTVGSFEVVLFTNVDEVIGAARTTSDAVLEQPLRLWGFVGHDLALTTPDLVSGLCVEINHYTSAGIYNRDGVYAFTGWGVFASAPAAGKPLSPTP